MVITNDNYHQFGNRALSRSKISDFLKSKQYFKAKHIDGTIVDEPKKAWDIGNGVDALLAQIDNKHKFIVCKVDRRTKAGKEEYAKIQASENIVLSDNEYEQIMGMACAVEVTKAFKQLKDFKKQEVLQIQWDLGDHFDSLVAMPDFILVSDNEAMVWDLKTAMTIDPRKYYFHCCEYQYFLQMAVIKAILEKINPNITNWEFGHITVEKTKNIWNVQTFLLDNERIELEKNNLIDNILPAIASEKDYKAYNPSLSTAIVIGSVNSEDEDW